MDHLLCRAVDLTGIAQLSSFFPMLAIVDRLSPRRRLIKKLFHIWEGMINERRESKGESIGAKSPHDFLSVLLSAEFSDPQVNALLLDIFVAGTDTATTTIEWVMAELIKNKPILENLRSELEREIGEDIVRESHLPHLHYLHACIKETQRLHPAVPLLVHEALQTCETMDCTIPKGCHVLVNVWAIGRDPETWEDPLTFSPQRFIDSSMGYKGNDFKFIPFGEGRRSCPGVPLVNQIVPLILASLIHSFEWSMPHGMDSGHLDMDEKFGLTLHKRHPLLLVPRARN
ncbi:probable (S)-N-methylcoclaurine 3'-hydroxylase isozyme 2 [Elaeis guineensis]|uniref:Probable (S)-N-methylcoclaurine 3'-hydroxylase isozyme 2 n=1 Tax=Elaeis guineensis var. tenera TaxID=51953 RepID=A0A8N4IBG5_ELAGV|nr:probable (S)-N-methylcoclaurine 3'-hydroxylase isozyme 2 [Elaeis guineensis]